MNPEHESRNMAPEMLPQKYDPRNATPEMLPQKYDLRNMTSEIWPHKCDPRNLTPKIKSEKYNRKYTGFHQNFRSSEFRNTTPSSWLKKFDPEIWPRKNFFRLNHLKLNLTWRLDQNVRSSIFWTIILNLKTEIQPSWFYTEGLILEYSFKNDRKMT